MAKQGQILALEKTAKGQAESVITRSHHVMQKDTLLTGISRTYQKKHEDGDDLPSERTLVQVRVHEEIAKVQAALARAFDLTATKEKTNTVVKADVVVDGVTLLRDVPGTVLLSLERELVNVATFVDKLPTLDLAEEWTFDDTKNAYATPPTQTVKDKKVPRNHVLAEATPQHAAQVQVYNESVVVGTWTQIKYSGALPAKELSEMKARVRTLHDAVKVARELANTADAVDLKVGDAMLNYVFAGTTPAK
jgi:hypothetical protein